MKVIDNKNLIPDKSILEKIVRKHPFSENLDSVINHLIIKPSPSRSNSESIKLNFTNNDVTLYIFRTTPSQKHYEYILYHEFGHIADKLTPKFKYSDKRKNSLTNIERLLVMELWNVYIDARLNDGNLFQLGNICSLLRINGKLQILQPSINVKLTDHINFLEQRGVKNAKRIIEEIWNNPNRFLSYEDMINIIKLNSNVVT